MKPFYPFKYAVLVLSVIITLFLIEIIFRFLLPTHQKSDNLGLDCYRNSDYLSYEYIPRCVGDMGGGKLVEINSIGLRGKEVGDKLNKRILLIGDSFVFGSGVSDNESLGSVLEKIIDQEVISAGFINTGPDTAYIYTVKEGLKLDPDLLILVLFPYNDLEDLEASVWQEDNNFPIKIKRRNEIVGENKRLVEKNPNSDNFLFRQSKRLRLLQFVKLNMDSISFRLKLLEMKTGIIFRSSTMEFKNYQNCLYHNQCFGKWMTAEIKANKILTLFKQLEKEKNIQLLVVTIPFADQVFENEPKNTLFDQLLEEKKISSLNLWNAMVFSEKTKKELYLSGGHWTPLGNIVAAQAIAKRLKLLNY